MIQTKILGSAPGIQYQGVQDMSETANADALTQATIIGRFKRGFTGKMFKVTKDTYQALLGYDPNNPDYSAVADAFDLGVPQLWVWRVGAPMGK